MIVDDSRNPDRGSPVFGSSPEIQIQFIRESDFLECNKEDETFLKLLAYNGIQLRGNLYFDRGRATLTQLLIIAESLLGLFSGLYDKGNFGKAQIRLKDAEIILNFICWKQGRDAVDFEPLWALLEAGPLHREETIPERDRVIQEALLQAKQAMIEGMIVNEMSREVEFSF